MSGVAHTHVNILFIQITPHVSLLQGCAIDVLSLVYMLPSQTCFVDDAHSMSLINLSLHQFKFVKMELKQIDKIRQISKVLSKRVKPMLTM